MASPTIYFPIKPRVPGVRITTHWTQSSFETSKTDLNFDRNNSPKHANPVKSISEQDQLLQYQLKTIKLIALHVHLTQSRIDLTMSSTFLEKLKLNPRVFKVASNLVEEEQKILNKRCRLFLKQFIQRVLNAQSAQEIEKVYDSFRTDYSFGAFSLLSAHSEGI